MSDTCRCGGEVIANDGRNDYCAKCGSILTATGWSG